MVWDADQPNAGFSDGTPWLPVKAPQSARAVSAQQSANDSVLGAYRDTLAFRKSQPALRWGETEFLELPEPFLGLRRTRDGKTLTCVYNLSPKAHRLTLRDKTELAGPSRASLQGKTLRLPANGFAWLEGAPALSA